MTILLKLRQLFYRDPHYHIRFVPASNFVLVRVPHCASPSRGTREGEGDRPKEKQKNIVALYAAVEGL